MPQDCLTTLTQRLRDFSAARDWERFHSPKNLAMALAAEAGELLEHFQWLTEAQSRELDPSQRELVAAELADVLLYLLRLADRLGIDLKTAAERKIAVNEKRYPVDRVRGSAKKYTEYQDIPGA